MTTTYILLMAGIVPGFAIRQRAEREQLEFILEKSAQIHSVGFDKAASYTNLVVSLGYAGFFGIWGLTKEFLPKFDVMVAACLLGLSLLIFISWTLLNAFLITLGQRQVALVIYRDYVSVSERFKATVDAENKGIKKTAFLFTIWPFVFALSSGSGLLGGALLFSHFAASILGYDFSVETWLSTSGD